MATTLAHDTTLSLRDYLAILRRRKWFFVLPAALVWAEGGFQPASTIASRLRRRARPAPADAG